MGIRDNKILTLGAVLGSIILFSGSVFAYPISPQPTAFPGASTMGLYLGNGASSVFVYDNGVGDANSAVGAVTFVGAVGGWNINVSTAISYPVQGSVTSPYLDLSSVNSATVGAGVLEIIATSGFFTTLPVGSTFSMGGTLSDGATADFNSWYCNWNWPFHQDYIIATSETFNGPGSFAGDYYGLISNPDGGPNQNYSISIQALLNDRDGGTSSFDAQLIVPEPSILLLLGVGLLGVGVIRRKK
jgi:hypothetical protein